MHLADTQPSGDVPPSASGATPIAPDVGLPLWLPASLDLNCAHTLHKELQSRVSADESLRIDGSDVERVSTACIQLLLAAAVSTRAHNVSFDIIAMSPVLRAAISDLGLERELRTGEAA